MKRLKTSNSSQNILFIFKELTKSPDPNFPLNPDLQFIEHVAPKLISGSTVPTESGSETWLKTKNHPIRSLDLLIRSVRPTVWPSWWTLTQSIILSSSSLDRCVSFS
jgi:hypothetical protein